MYVLVGVLLCLNVYQCRRAQNSVPPCGIYTDTLTVFDTIPFYKPVPRDSVVVRYITETLPVTPETKPEPEDTVDMETLPVPADSATVEIPITQKVYKDSTYTAYVSGYHPQLDSLFIYPQTKFINTVHRPKPKRWGIGLQVGYGITMKNQPQFVPYIGIGISYNLFNF